MSEKQTAEQCLYQKRPLTSAVLTGTIAGILVVFLTGGIRTLINRTEAIDPISVTTEPSINSDNEQPEIPQQSEILEDSKVLDGPIQSSGEENGNINNIAVGERSEKTETSSKHKIRAAIVLIVSMFAIFNMIFLASIVERTIEDKIVSKYAKVLCFIIGLCLSVIIYAAFGLLYK